jgi:archaellum component FlaC
MSREVFEQKQFGKTYDVNTDQFVVLKDANLETLEALRFLDTQINLIYMKIERIIKMLEKANPEALSKKGIEKVERLNERFVIFNAKLDLVKTRLDDIERSLISMENDSDGLAGISDGSKEIMVKIADIEKMYGAVSSYRVKNVYLNLVEMVGMLGKRINNIETVMERAGYKFDKSVVGGAHEV